MTKFKRMTAFLLLTVLLATCIPLGAVPAFAAGEALPLGGSSGSEIGDGGDGGGNPAGDGASYMVAVGVTMQVVYYRYDQCFNRYNSHGSVVQTLQSGKALPWNATGKDNGTQETTVFDTFTLSPHTFLVKAQYKDFPFVYHFPNSHLQSDNCTFDWTAFTNFWFNAENPGGKPETYPLIVRNEQGGSLEIEQFLARIILGNSYGAWDKLNVAKGQTVATDSSLYAAVLKYLGASDLAIQNYLDAYFGKLSISQNGSTLIPTIIWSWVGAENLGKVNRIYTIGDVADVGSANTNWLKTAYASSAKATEGFGSCSWMKTSSDTMLCKLMMGAGHAGTGKHNDTIWTKNAANLFGTGYVNRIQTQVDATEENGTNTFYYLRGYWTPYGSGKGSILLTKTNVSGTVKLSGAEFTLYRDAACTIPVTADDFDTLSSTDAGYVSPSLRRTNSSGQATWTGLYTGTYFLKETKAPAGYQLNVDAGGNVQVREVNVANGTTNVTLTNAENAKVVTLKKSINASIDCIDQLKGNPMYTLSGAEYTISVGGKVMETLKTDASGNAVSTRKYTVGTVLTIRETKAPAGFVLDTRTYTYTVTSGENVFSVADVPMFDPPFVLTKIDKVTTVPQGDATFSGAVFKWEYFANGSWSGAPTRTWYFRTDANGRCIYDKNALATEYTNSALYFSPAGTSMLPLGTLRITEVKNALGYTVIPEPLYCSIVSVNGTAKHVWTDESFAILTRIASEDYGVEEPIDRDGFGSVTIFKYDALTGATLAGAKFQIINSSKNAVVIDGKTIAPGQVCVELTTDANGRAAAGKIFPIGTYTIRESAAPAGYNLNTGWSRSFAVTDTVRDFVFQGDQGCFDTVISGKIRILKQILNPTNDMTAPESGARFSVKDATGKVVDTIVTDSDGVGISRDLPYGTYTVTQISGAAGTVLCDPWTVTILQQDTVVTYEKQNKLWTATVSVHKEAEDTRQPLIAAFSLCERDENGKVRVLETGTTDERGNLYFLHRIAYADGVCNKSTYFVREVKAPAGYRLDRREHPVSCIANNLRITITVTNVPTDGSIELRKTDPWETPLEDVVFLLEYSPDGQTWEPVMHREEGDSPECGTCTSENLEDGMLCTDENGIAVFLGLRVTDDDGEPVFYRVTEIRTVDGFSLMSGPVWEGDLTENPEPILGVVNAPILQLPMTGSAAGRILPIFAALCVLMGTLLLICRTKKKEG